MTASDHAWRAALAARGWRLLPPVSLVERTADDHTRRRYVAAEGVQDG